MKIKKTGLQPFSLNEEFAKANISATGVFSFRRGLFQVLTAWLLSLFLYGRASAQEKTPIVRLAKLQIDAVQLENYKASLKEEIETSVRVELGVLSLYAVSEKDNPTRITIFEIYANEDGYKAHLESTHFKKYKSATKDMVKSLELIETVPLFLGAKAK